LIYYNKLYYDKLHPMFNDGGVRMPVHLRLAPIVIVVAR
jgi:hypothetical protein